MLILHSSRFIKKAAKLDQKLRKALRERLGIFDIEPNHPLLNNHALQGKRRHQRSINITGDWRLIYEQVDSSTVRLLDIDTHTNLYGA
jgi:addiction module RelE/StbE family toxin